MLTKNSLIEGELVVFVALKFCNTQNLGTETLNLAVERLVVGEEKA